jgi:hypothetical protein
MEGSGVTVIISGAENEVSSALAVSTARADDTPASKPLNMNPCTSIARRQMFVCI